MADEIQEFRTKIQTPNFVADYCSVGSMSVHLLISCDGAAVGLVDFMSEGHVPVEIYFLFALKIITLKTPMLGSIPVHFENLKPGYQKFLLDTFLKFQGEVKEQY